MHNAVNAATSDPRFSAVKRDELASITLSVSVLDVPRPLEALPPDALLTRLGSSKPGVVLEFHDHRSTFLPQVWEELPEPKGFLGHLCRSRARRRTAGATPPPHYQTYAVQLFEEKAGN